MIGRFVDWLRNLQAKSTTIDGTEQLPIDSSGLSMRATIANLIRYGGGSPRTETMGNATVTRTTDGAIYLEVAGQTVGNTRGAGAFDWQAVRSSATAVASGANSIAMGRECTANGSFSIAMGTGCTSTTVGAAIGQNVIQTNAGQLAYGVGVNGCQGNLQPFMTFTTDATLTPLNTTNAVSTRMVIPAARSVAFIGIVQAMCNVSLSSNFIKAWKIEGVITRDGNNTTRIVGTPTITILAQDSDGTPTPSTWAITSITADDTNESLSINVTGQNGQTIRWQASLFYSQVGY